jgi:hypothetical protein
VQLRIEQDEAWSLMLVVTSYIIDNSGVSQEAKQKIRQWRNDHAEGTQEMAALSDGMNEAVGAYMEHRTDRTVRRRGRYQRVSERK